MKQLTHALTGEAFTVPSRAVPTATVPCAPARLRSEGTGLPVVLGTVEPMAYATTGRFTSLHGASGRVAIPTNAHRRPPETPT